MVVVLLIAAAVAVPLLLSEEQTGPQRSVAAPGTDPDLGEVVTFTTLRSDHVTETIDDHQSSPPAGGKHFAVWLGCGVYDEPVRDEFAAHDLDAPVVVSVWEAQLALSGVDDPRLGLFLDEFAGGVTAPEPLASCAGGASLADIEELGLPTDVEQG